MKKASALLIMILLLLPNMALAENAHVKKTAASVESPAQPESRVKTALPEKDKAAPPVDCAYAPPEKPVYKGQFIAVRKKGFVAKKEAFETKVYVQNTGNTPWFSANSGCKGPVANLGTEKNRDRSSPFFTNSLFWKSNWAGPNRVIMETPRVDPKGLATFTFWSQAPDRDGLYREYFDVVIEGVTWLDGAMFSTDIKVGEPGLEPEKRDLLKYIEKSVNLADIDLNGEKNIEIDLSMQRLRLKIGDYVIRDFPTSTGKARTPTPVGTTYILEKRQVRVAAGTPHWIMPKWMMFRRGGYGIHALPSLANDGGVYWREALNHIGTPRSHGCVRLLPADAEFAYEFTDVGTKVVVHR